MRKHREFKITQKTLDRFWAKVVKHPNGYWEWTGARKQDKYGGHGLFKAGEKDAPIVPAHTFSFYLKHCWHQRKKLPNNKDLCHCPKKSFGPLDVNPDHLYLGSRSENLLDRTFQNNYKYPNKTIKKVLKLRQQGYKHKDIKSETGMSMGHISEIINRNTRPLPEDLELSNN